MANNALDVLTVRATGVVGLAYSNPTSMEMRWAHVQYTSTATAGNRSLNFALKDRDGNLLYDINAGANQGASLTRHYNFVHGVPRETGFQGNAEEMVMPMAHLFVEAGFTMTITDVNAVDAADSLILTFQADR